MSSIYPELGSEEVSQDEKVITDQIAKLTLQAAAFAAMQSKVKEWPARRLAHPKSHGCVNATFTVVSSFPEDLPDELKNKLAVGVFQPGKSYPAKIRFSNGDPRVQVDTEPDVRGMAIKLALRDPFEQGKLVENPHQDFLLTNDKAFFSKDAQDYLEFTESLTRFNGTRAHFGKYPDLAKVYGRSQVPMENPLKMEYYSQVPYRLGKLAVKYAARPVSDVPNYSGEKEPDFLKKALAETLQGDLFSLISWFRCERPNPCLSRIPA